jgi:predicted GIY-YIG superfamily endonuclease
MNPRLACYYIGQTAHDPTTRYKQHKTGYKANRFVKKYGLKLIPQKFERFNRIEKRERAKQIEQWITYKLRKKGHGVWSN